MTSAIVLTKNAPSISLDKRATGIMTVTIYWGDAKADVDLGCLWRTTSGRTGVFQALGKVFGSLKQAPYIQLDADERSGGSSVSETMRFDVSHGDELDLAVFFAYVYSYGGSSGNTNWANVGDVRVVINHPTQGEIEMRMDRTNARSCALVSLRREGSGLKLRREEVYFSGVQQDIDKHFGFGMNWHSARK